MPGLDRSAGRTLQLYNSSDKENVIGGLIVTNGITHANLYFMVEIIVVATSEFTLRDEDDMDIPKDDAQVEPGDYFINAASKIYTALISTRC